VFEGNMEILDFLINDVQTLLYNPEDLIINQGQKGKTFFFLAKGDCEVWVKDHMKHNNLIQSLQQGDYFGEIALLTDTVRSANIKSTNYCTLAGISQEVFHGMCERFNEIYINLKQRAI
jgi:CRP-like cAMP-binding protein